MRKWTFYREAHVLFADIFQARTLGTYKKLAHQIQSADLVVIDDLFLLKLPKDAGEMPMSLSLELE